MRIGLLALFVATAACAAQARSGAAPADLVATGVTCDTSRVGKEVGDERTWREMRGDGFTYCVPADWQATGARAQLWRSPTSEFSWGEPHEAFEGPTPAFRPTTAQPHIGFRVLTESVNGHTLRLYVADPGAGSAFRTAAEWLEASLELYGTAHTADGARDILAVVRSVRFTKR